MEHRHSRKRSIAGFTMAEVLITVGIVAILLAVAVPGVIAARASLKMTELDATAREIFLAAQNSLTGHKAAGTLEQVGALSGGDPRFLRDGESGMDALLPLGAIDPTVAGNHYIVRLNLEYATVLDVFYSEAGFVGDLAGMTDKEIYVKLHDDTAARKELQVGYYNGGGLDYVPLEQLPAPVVELVNNDELRVNVMLPADVDLTKTTLTVTVEGLDSGKSVSFPLKAGAVDRKATKLLDSLVAGEQFSAICPGLTPGEQIRVTARLEAADCLPSSASFETNSLFANRQGDTVFIACGRHLQNLDCGTSGVFGVTAAVQTAEITWPSGFNFIPIESYDLLSYSGNKLPIRNLSISSAQTVNRKSYGLFGDIWYNSLVTPSVNLQISGVRIVNPDIRIGSNDMGTNVGALAGSATDVEISDCLVYLEKAQETADYTDYAISGPGSVGGLIGKASKCTITSSAVGLYSVKGTSGCEYLGGLIGKAEQCTIKTSYASVDQLGGTATAAVSMFVGRGDGTTVSECYAAGNISANTTGTVINGFMQGEGTTSGESGIRNSYCAVTYYGKDGQPRGADFKINQAFSPAAAGNCAYLETGADARSETAAATALAYDALKEWSGIGGAALAPELSHPYQAELDGKAYPFPALKLSDGSSIPHYGSWPVQNVDAIAVFENNVAATNGNDPKVNVVFCPEGGSVTVYAEAQFGDKPARQAVEIKDAPSTFKAEISEHAYDSATGRTALQITALDQCGIYTMDLSSGSIVLRTIVVIYRAELSMTVNSSVVNTADSLNGQSQRNTSILHGAGRVVTVPPSGCSVKVTPSWAEIDVMCATLSKDVDTSLGDRTWEQLVTRERWEGLNSGDPFVLTGLGTILTDMSGTDGLSLLTTGATGSAVIAARWAFDPRVKVECPIQAIGVSATIHYINLTTEVIKPPKEIEYPSQLTLEARAGDALIFHLEPKIFGDVDTAGGIYSWSVESPDGGSSARLDDPSVEKPVLTLSGKGVYTVKLVYTASETAGGGLYRDQVTLRVTRRSNHSDETNIHLNVTGGTSFIGGTVKLEQLDKPKDDGSRWNTAVLTAYAVGATDDQVSWYMGLDATGTEITGSHSIRMDENGVYYLDGDIGKAVATAILDSEGRLTITALDRDEYFEDLNFPVFIQARDQVQNGSASRQITVQIMRRLMLSPQAVIESAGWFTKDKQVTVKTNRPNENWAFNWELLGGEKDYKGSLNYRHLTNTSKSGATLVLGLLRTDWVLGLPKSYSCTVLLNYGPFSDDDSVTGTAEIKGSSFGDKVSTINEELAGRFFFVTKGTSKPMTFAWGGSYSVDSVNATLDKGKSVYLSEPESSQKYVQTYEVSGLNFGSDMSIFSGGSVNVSYPIHSVGIELPKTVYIQGLASVPFSGGSLYFPADPLSSDSEPKHTNLSAALVDKSLTISSSDPETATIKTDGGNIEIFPQKYGNTVLTATYTIQYKGYTYQYSDVCEVTVAPDTEAKVYVQPVTDAAELEGKLYDGSLGTPALYNAGGSISLMASPYVAEDFNSMYFKCWIGSDADALDPNLFSSVDCYTSNAQTATAEEVGRDGGYVYIKLTAKLGSPSGDPVVLNVSFGANEGQSAAVLCYDEPHVTLMTSSGDLGGVTDENHIFGDGVMEPSEWQFTAEEMNPLYYADGTPASGIRWEQLYPDEEYKQTVFITYDTSSPTLEAEGTHVTATVLMNPMCKVVIQAASTMVNKADTANCCATFGLVFLPPDSSQGESGGESTDVLEGIGYLTGSWAGGSFHYQFVDVYGKVTDLEQSSSSENDNWKFCYNPDVFDPSHWFYWQAGQYVAKNLMSAIQSKNHKVEVNGVEYIVASDLTLATGEIYFYAEKPKAEGQRPPGWDFILSKKT